MSTLTGTIKDAGGTAYTGYLRFTPRVSPLAKATYVVNGKPVDVQCSTLGAFSVTLAAGAYWVTQENSHPFAVNLVDDAMAYQLQNVMVYDNASVAMPYVYLWNADTSLYHKVNLGGAGTEVHMEVEQTGVATAPFGLSLNQLVMWNADDGMYRTVRAIGTSVTTLELEVAATNQVYLGTGVPSDGGPGTGGITSGSIFYVNTSTGAVYYWNGTRWVAIIAEP